jgi:hypothetical protein
MVKLKAAAAPVNNFTPRKEKEKKHEEEKKKNIAIFLGGRIGLSRFLEKILPKACGSVEIFSQNTKCLTFTAQSAGLCW